HGRAEKTRTFVRRNGTLGPALVSTSVVSGTRLRGVVLAITPQHRFAAATIVSGQVMTRFSGGSAGVRHPADAADGVPVITDTPQRARELLGAGRIGEPIIWDVLELATLLVPRCPRDSLQRAADFFGIKTDRSGLDDQVQRLEMLFELL